MSNAQYLRGGKPGFSWLRLKQVVWRDATRVLEFAIGLFFFVFRGVYLLWVGFDHVPVERFLYEVNLSDTALGMMCLIVGLWQIYGSATERRGLRVVIACAGVAVASLVQIAYYESTHQWESVSVVWLSVILADCYIMLRNFLGMGDDTD